MKYSKEEIIQYVKEEDVKFIRLAFCDVFGRQKNVSIMAEELPVPLNTELPLMPLPSLDSAMKQSAICCSIPMRKP